MQIELIRNSLTTSLNDLRYRMRNLMLFSKILSGEELLAVKTKIILMNIEEDRISQILIKLSTKSANDNLPVEMPGELYIEHFLGGGLL